MRPNPRPDFLEGVGRKVLTNLAEPVVLHPVEVKRNEIPDLFEPLYPRFRPHGTGLELADHPLDIVELVLEGMGQPLQRRNLAHSRIKDILFGGLMTPPIVREVLEESLTRYDTIVRGYLIDRNLQGRVRGAKGMKQIFVGMHGRLLGIEASRGFRSVNSPYRSSMSLA